MKKWQFILVKAFWNHCYQNQKCCYSTLSIMTPEDLFIMFFTAEQLNLILKIFWINRKYRFWKWIFKIAYKYIRNVSLMDVEDLRWNNYFLRPKTEIILYFSTHENHFRKIQRKTHLSPKGLPVRPTDMSKRHYSMYWTTISVLKDWKYGFSGTGNKLICLKRSNHISRWRFWCVKSSWHGIWSCSTKVMFKVF
jgi:hypothetical protein